LFGGYDQNSGLTRGFSAMTMPLCTMDSDFASFYFNSSSLRLPISSVLFLDFCYVYFSAWLFPPFKFLSLLLHTIYSSGLQPGVRIAPGLREDILGVWENILRGLMINIG
jgi:hypothetical protein